MVSAKAAIVIFRTKLMEHYVPDAVWHLSMAQIWLDQDLLSKYTGFLLPNATVALGQIEKQILSWKI